jgi:hypothetical protein
VKRTIVGLKFSLNILCDFYPSRGISNIFATVGFGTNIYIIIINSAYVVYHSRSQARIKEEGLC